MGEQSSGDKLSLDPEKAYYLQRIDVLNECRTELLSSLKRSVWLLLAVTAIVGYLGLDTILRQRLSDEGTLVLLERNLRKNDEFVRQVADNINIPVTVYRATSKIEIPANGGSSATIVCPHGMLPIGGGFKNSKSAVNLVQINAEKGGLLLSLDNRGGEDFVVDVWALCLKAHEEQSGAAS